MHASPETAIMREKQKKCKRKWKLELIEKGNPTWNDLYSEIIQGTGFLLEFIPAKAGAGMTLKGI